MLETEVNSSIWTRQYISKNYTGNIHVFTTKPKNNGDEVKKYSKYISVQFEESDFQKIKEWYLTLPNIGTKDPNKITITSYLLKDYYLKCIVNNSGNYVYYDGPNEYFIYRDSKDIIKPLKFVRLDFPCILDTTKTRQEIKEDARKAETKVIDAIMLDGINEVLKKYGMLCDGNGIRFKDNKSLKDFVQIAFDNTVGKDLHDIGIDYTIYKRSQKISAKSPLVLKSDLRLRKDK